MASRPQYTSAQVAWAARMGYSIDPADGYMKNPAGGRVIPPTDAAIAGASPEAGGVPAPTPAGPTQEQKSARAYIEELLRGWGLESLSGWAWEQILAGNSEMLPQLIRGTEAYKQRFAGLEQRRAKGLNVMSEAEYLSLENSYRTIMRSYGIPQGVFDTQGDLAEFIAADLSPNELNDRLRIYQDAAYNAPQEVRNQLSTLYGINEGALIAYYIDPEKALPVLQQQYMAAGAASASVRAGFSQFSATEAERLAQLGANANSLEEFDRLNRSRELFTGLSREVNQNAVSEFDAAEGTFGGDKVAADLLERRARERVAEFAGGGAFVRSARGASGIGTARS